METQQWPSTIRGLGRTNNRLYENFFALIQEEASKQGNVFFVMDLEGHEDDVCGVHTEDLSGWLIPFALADEFENEWKKDLSSVSDKWDDYLVFEFWSITSEGKLSIKFKLMNSY